MLITGRILELAGQPNYDKICQKIAEEIVSNVMIKGFNKKSNVRDYISESNLIILDRILLTEGTMKDLAKGVQMTVIENLAKVLTPKVKKKLISAAAAALIITSLAFNLGISKDAPQVTNALNQVNQTHIVDSSSSSGGLDGQVPDVDDGVNNKVKPDLNKSKVDLNKIGPTGSGGGGEEEPANELITGGGWSDTTKAVDSVDDSLNDSSPVDDVDDNEDDTSNVKQDKAFEKQANKIIKNLVSKASSDKELSSKIKSGELDNRLKAEIKSGNKLVVSSSPEADRYKINTIANDMGLTGKITPIGIGGGLAIYSIAP
jgi:hypothetical protein